MNYPAYDINDESTSVQYVQTDPLVMPASWPTVPDALYNIGLDNYTNPSNVYPANHYLLGSAMENANVSAPVEMLRLPWAGEAAYQARTTPSKLDFNAPIWKAPEPTFIWSDTGF